jgi:ubiquinone/menaquinone biosynthesis C-methylase UbiE
MTKRRTNDFDRIAGLYDFLVRLVFGKKLINAQLHFLDKVPRNGRILILGGGTGELAAVLLNQQPQASITYLDASAKMISLARRRLKESAPVSFILGTEESLPALGLFDVVITNFYLDMFSDSTLPTVLERIQSALAPDGLWLVTDFVSTNNVKHKVLLKVMYCFFRVVSRIDATHLPDWYGLLNRHAIHSGKKNFSGGMIQSCWFRFRDVEPRSRISIRNVP